MERRPRARMPPRLGVVLARERARAIRRPLAHQERRPVPARMRARRGAGSGAGDGAPPAGEEEARAQEG